MCMPLMPTVFISLDDFVDALNPEIKALWNRIWIRYGANETIVHPLIYHHPLTDFEASCRVLMHLGTPFSVVTPSILTS